MSYPSRRRRVVSGLGQAAFYDVPSNANEAQSNQLVLGGDDRLKPQTSAETAYSGPNTGVPTLNGHNNISDAVTALLQYVAGSASPYQVISSSVSSITAMPGVGKHYVVYHEDSGVTLNLLSGQYPEGSHFTIYSSPGPDRTGGARPSRKILINFGSESLAYTVNNYDVFDTGSSVKFTKIDGTWHQSPASSNNTGDVVEPESTTLIVMPEFAPATSGVAASFVASGAAISNVLVEIFEYPASGALASGPTSNVLTVTSDIATATRTISLQGADPTIAPTTVTDSAGAAPAVNGSMDDFSIPSVSLGRHNIKYTFTHAGGTDEIWAN